MLYRLIPGVLWMSFAPSESLTNIAGPLFRGVRSGVLLDTLDPGGPRLRAPVGPFPPRWGFTLERLELDGC